MSNTRGARPFFRIRTQVAVLFKRFRISGGYSQKQFGDLLGISSNYLYMIENARALPSMKLLKTFCRLIGYNYRLAKLKLFQNRIDLFAEALKKKMKIDD